MTLGRRGGLLLGKVREDSSFEFSRKDPEDSAPRPLEEMERRKAAFEAQAIPPKRQKAREIKWATIQATQFVSDAPAAGDSIGDVGYNALEDQLERWRTSIGEPEFVDYTFMTDSGTFFVLILYAE